MRTVACFGDSLIFGFPYGPKESWIAEVEAETGVTMLIMAYAAIAVTILCTA